MRFLLSLLAFLALPLMLPAALTAQDRPNTILILDGSGSMWGQIDGLNKIVIARDVIGELLQTFPADQNLGLAAYGHRNRGDCADIETLVQPGEGTLPAIRDAVNAIQPKGKTPMTDAIIAAAEALRYTEEKATVILVSDGIETCHPDPCAAARVLEEAGIDFTAHVVGFDVTDPEALAQMQCLAGETGGTFSSASDAAGLIDALTTVVAEPVYVPQTVQIVGVLAPGGAEIADAVTWNIQPGQGANFDGAGPGFAIDLPAGGYDVVGTRQSDGATGQAVFDVAAFEADQGQRVEVIFPEPAPEPAVVSFRAVIGSEDGPDIQTPVFWELNQGDMPILDDVMGNPIPELLAQGSYTVTAYWAEHELTSAPRQFIATAEPREIVVVFEKPLPTATITAPASAVAGSVIEVAWNGPNMPDDYLGIGAVGAKGAGRWDNYTYTREGSTLQLLVPITPGPHEITYFQADGRVPLGSTSIEVTPVAASVTAPASAVAGSTIELAWTGPNYPDDYIGIGPAGATGSDLWRNFTYTREGAPLMLQIPPEPGAYQITYFASQDRTALASATLTVTEPQVGVTAPATAVAGTMVEIGWVGPDQKDDYIGIGVEGAGGGARWQNFTYTREGNPLMLEMPLSEGPHVITYFLSQDRTPLASTTITLTAPEISVTAPATAEGGSMIEVAWTGPDYQDDYIGIGLVGAGGGDRWRNYTYTREGSPLRLQVPPEPGTYEITYFASQERTALASVTMEVTAPVTRVTAPATAVAGSMVEIGWQGPDQPDDYIGVGLEGAGGGDRWANFTYTRDGSPMQLKMPLTTGAHTVTYFLSQDRTPLASTTITLTAPNVSLMAPASAAAGSSVEIGWQGPDYPDDYIAIGPVGATGGSRWQAYTYTREGNPLQLQLPEAPGNYVIRYFASQGRTPLAEVPITLN